MATILASFSRKPGKLVYVTLCFKFEQMFSTSSASLNSLQQTWKVCHESRLYVYDFPICDTTRYHNSNKAAQCQQQLNIIALFAAI